VAGLHQAGATTSEVKVPEAVVTTVEEGATGGVSSVTGRIMGAEVVAEVAQHVELMSVTRGLTMLDMLVVVVAAQQLLVHLQNEGQHSCCTSLESVVPWPSDCFEVGIELHQLVEFGITRKDWIQIMRVPVLDHYFCRQQKRKK